MNTRATVGPREGSRADAFIRARQYDAVYSVAQAMTWYERAYRHLLEDDPNRKTAADRLAVLRAW